MSIEKISSKAGMKHKVVVMRNGKRIQGGTFPTREEAERRNSELEIIPPGRSISNQYQSKIPLDRLFKEWFDDYKRKPVKGRPKSDGTVYNKQYNFNNLSPFHSNYLFEITKESLANFLEKQQCESPSAVRHSLFLLSEISKFSSKKYGPPNEFPFNAEEVFNDFKEYAAERNTRKEYLYTSEINLIFDLLLKSSVSKNVHVAAPWVFLFLVSTGIRVGEFCGLEWGNVFIDRSNPDNPTGEINIIQRCVNGKIQPGTKTGRKDTRRVPLSVPAIKALDEMRKLSVQYNKTFNCNNPFVVTPRYYSAGKLDRPVRVGCVQTIFGVGTENKKSLSIQMLMKKEGIVLRKVKSLGPHICRHTFATQYLHLSGNTMAAARTLQGYMGHKDLEQTLDYAKIVDEDNDTSIKALNNFGRKNIIPLLPIPNSATETEMELLKIIADAHAQLSKLAAQRVPSSE